LALCSLFLVLIVSACTEHDSTVDVKQDGETLISLSAPRFLITRAINFSDLKPSVFINDIPLDIFPQGENWTGTTTVAQNSAVTLKVEWNEVQSDNQLLLLASAFDNQYQNVTGPLNFIVRDTSYTTTGLRGERFDPDSDGVSNLEERERGRNPYVADADPNDVAPDVQIFPTIRETEIDGSVGTDTFWNNGVYTDVNRETLYIDSMIRDDIGGTQELIEPKYQWTAIHDGEDLIIFVYGKARNATMQISGDSGDEYFKDDSLEIFWDGNLSRLQGYDGVDDMLVNIPLARGPGPVFEPNNSGAFNKRIFRGGNVKDEFIFDVDDEDNIEFATCFCDGERTTWEVRINLAAAKIPVGKTFGFEIQINRDDDGGERDSKWAWAKPARLPTQTDDEADITWIYPNQMGKARLIPFPTEL